MSTLELPPGVVQVLSEPAVAGRYAPTRLLGVGGFGAVVAATDRQLERTVALKIMCGVDRQAAQRLVREGKLLARLSHPCIVRVFSSELVGEVPVLVLELVEGVPLDVELERGPLHPDRAVAIAIQLLDALHAAHASGIVHRDLKPSNVILTADRPKLLDFGIARPVDLDPRSSAAITASGVITGTPSYMAPEQCQGEPPDARADLYALGIVLYEMLAGHPPFRGAPVDTLLAHINTPPPPLGQACPAAPAHVVEAVHRALAKSPQMRFPDAAAMVDGLAGKPVRLTAVAPRQARGSGRTAVASRTDRAEPVSRRGPLLLAAGALAIGLAAWSSTARPPPPPASPSPSQVAPAPSAEPDPIDDVDEVVHGPGDVLDTITAGHERTFVQVRTEAPCVLHLWSSPLASPAAARYAQDQPIIKGIQDWKLEASSAHKGILHRLTARWIGPARARYLKLTLAKRPRGRSLLAFVDVRRASRVSPKELLSYQRYDALAQMGGLPRTCDPLIDVRPLLAGAASDLHLYTLKYLANNPDREAQTIALEHLRRVYARDHYGEDYGWTMEALGVAEADVAHEVWALVKSRDQVATMRASVTLAAPASFDDALADRLENDVVSQGPRCVAIAAIVQSMRPDRGARIARMLERADTGPGFLPQALAFAVSPEDAIADLCRRRPEFLAALYSPAVIEQLHVHRRHELIEMAFAAAEAARQPPAVLHLLVAAMGDCRPSGALLARLGELARAVGPLQSTAQLALARAAQPVPALETHRPDMLTALAAASDASVDRAALLESWASNDKLSPPVRGAALVGLALRWPERWAVTLAALKKRAPDGLAQCEIAVRELERYDKAVEPLKQRPRWHARDGMQGAQDALSWAFVLPGYPGFWRQPTQRRVGSRPRLDALGMFGWWPGGMPQLRAWSTQCTFSPQKVETGVFSVDSYAAAHGEAVAGFFLDIPPPAPDTALAWTAFSETSNR